MTALPLPTLTSTPPALGVVSAATRDVTGFRARIQARQNRPNAANYQPTDDWYLIRVSGNVRAAAQTMHRDGVLVTLFLNGKVYIRHIAELGERVEGRELAGWYGDDYRRAGK